MKTRGVSSQLQTKGAAPGAAPTAVDHGARMIRLPSEFEPYKEVLNVDLDSKDGRFRVDPWRQCAKSAASTCRLRTGRDPQL